MTPDEINAKGLADDLQEWRHTFTERMDSFDTRLKENSEATARVESNTSELVSILNSWKGAMKVMDFIGRMAKPLAAVVGLIGAFFAWWHSK